MKVIGIPKLAEDQMEELSEIAEETARSHILSRVPQRVISKLNIVVEAVGEKPILVLIDIDLSLSPTAKSLESEKLVNEATEKAFDAVENCLREMSCASKI